MLSEETKACRKRCFLTFIYRLNGCGMWLALISLPLALLWLWFGDTLRLAAPRDARVIEMVVYHIVLTTFIVFIASWLIGRFRTWRLDAKNSLNS